ncbi:MAG: methyl-accepting chemotaxis protein [Actinomycetales bacterium]|nr:methyl-accepting chemotaxis protein [Actinomycetales bacterium]
MQPTDAARPTIALETGPLGASATDGRTRASLLDPPVTIKILGGVAVAVLGMLVIAGTALTYLGQLRDRGQAINDVSLANVVALEEIRRQYLQVRVDALGDGLLGTSDDGPEHAAFLKDVDALDAAVEAMGERSLTEEQREHLGDLADAWAAYQKVVGGALLEVARTGDEKAYIALRDKEVKPIAVDIQLHLDELVEAVQTQTSTTVADNDRAYHSARTSMIGVLVVVGLLSLLLAGYASRRTVVPLRRVRDACLAIAEGDLTRTVDIRGRDEIAQTARALDHATANTRETVRALAASATTLASAAEELNATSETITTSAETTSARVGTVMRAVDTVSDHVNSIAAGAEEMSSSITEIARNANDAAQMGTHARELADATNVTVAKLGDSSTEIGNVIKVINSIAEQTNLLSLNATIEAARAGESGKGFAVVAGEVKELAQETARATEDIARRVEAIQSDSSGAAEAIGEIANVISRLGDFQTVIASAVEEQTVTTRSMSENVNQASSQTGQIVDGVSEVVGAASTTAAGAEQARTAVLELSRMSSELHAMVARFRL